MPANTPPSPRLPRWAPLIAPELIVRLYRSDAKGLLNEDLLEVVLFALYCRCISIRQVTEAYDGRVTCPECGQSIARHTPMKDKDALLRCAGCAWTCRWGDYHLTFQGKDLKGHNFWPLVEGFLAGHSHARTPGEKMILIDSLIHAVHNGTMKSAACSFLRGSASQLRNVLDALAYGDTSTPGLAATKESWMQTQKRHDPTWAGHPAALRPMPDHIDSHQQVPLPTDEQGREACPWCKSCLSDVEDRERIVVDIIPAKVVVTCYHTRNGWCPCCRKQVESRALEQPPVPPVPARCGQVGINALATAMLVRIAHRLPFRQVRQIFLDLPHFSISPGAVADQVQRVGRWLEGEYEQMILRLGCAKVVHADETGGRTDGKPIAKPMTQYRKELTAFLWDKDLDGTNNAAERALQPAVVAGKISGGSHSDNGAEAWAALASLMRSTGQQGQRVLDTIKAMLTAAWASEEPPTILTGE